MRTTTTTTTTMATTTWVCSSTSTRTRKYGKCGLSPNHDKPSDYCSPLGSTSRAGGRGENERTSRGSHDDQGTQACCSTSTSFSRLRRLPLFFIGTLWLSAQWPAALAGIFKHELVDGEIREISCASLDDCFSKGVSTPGMLLHRSWATEIEAALDQRTAAVSAVNGSGHFKWQARVRSLWRKLFKLQKPEGPPPVRQVRRYQDFARNVSVTMLVFESHMGNSIPAVLFAPLGAETAGILQPAVLHLPGHLAPGLRDEAEQKVSLALAQRGYTVLSFDPVSQGERLQYPKEFGLECQTGPSSIETLFGNCQASGPPCSTAHDHFGKQLWLLGHSAAELFVQDAKRGLDLLAELPWVDEKRLGVIGCSGGGMLTSYLAATDDRVQVAAIGCYFSTLGQELETGSCNYDAEQIIWRQAQLGLDKTDLLIARAPKPTLVLLTSHDCFPLSGAQAGWHEASRFFASHGQNHLGEFGLGVSETAGFHGFTAPGLQTVWQYFEDYLRPLPSELPEVTEPLECEKLLFGAQHLEQGATGSRPVRITEIVRKLAAPVLKRLHWRSYRHLVLQAPSCLKDLSASRAGLDVSSALGAHPLVQFDLLSPVKARWYNGGMEEWYVLPSSHSCSITARLYRFTESYKLQPGGPLLRGSSLVILFGGGVELNRALSDFEEAFLMRMHHQQVSVLFAGLCGVGDDMWRGGLWEYGPLLLGRTNVGLHAEEVIRTVRFALHRLEASGGIVLASVGGELHSPLLGGYEAPPATMPGGTASALLHAVPHLPLKARTGGPAVVGLALYREQCSYAAAAVALRHRLPWLMQMVGVLEDYDLPDLLALLSRRPHLRLLLLDPLAATGRKLSRLAAQRTFKAAARAYSEVGRPLRLIVRPDKGPGDASKVMADFVAKAVNRQYM